MATDWLVATVASKMYWLVAAMPLAKVVVSELPPISTAHVVATADRKTVPPEASIVIVWPAAKPFVVVKKKVTDVGVTLVRALLGSKITPILPTVYPVTDTEESVVDVYVKATTVAAAPCAAKLSVQVKTSLVRIGTDLPDATVATSVWVSVVAKVKVVVSS